MTGLKRSVFDLLLYQAGWCMCIFGAASERSWAGAVYGVLAMMAHLAIVPRPGRTLAATALVAGVGFLVDGAWTLLGLLVFPQQSHLFGLLPPWMLALWAMFCFLMDSVFRFLRGRPALAAVIGAVGGPLAYLGGERIGALEVEGFAGAAAVTATWALAMPFAVAVFAWMRPSDPSTRPAAP